MKTLTYRITGLAPLLMHNVNCMALKKPNGTSHEDWEMSEECFRSKMYTDSSGENFLLPSRMLRGAMLAAASKLYSQKIKPSSGGSYKTLLAPLVFFSDGIELDQKVSEVDRENQFVTINKNKVQRVWPKLNEWTGTFDVIVADPARIADDEIDMVFDTAGNLCGLGDYRPQFGRFSVERLS